MSASQKKVGGWLVTVEVVRASREASSLVPYDGNG
jgi:hypothetical protein